MLLLTRSTDYLALGSRKTKQSICGTLTHNLGVMLIVVQVLALYAVSGLYKLGGDLWINGTAVYYVLRTPDFMASSLNSLLFTNAAAVTSATYTSMLLLASMPLLVLNPRTREHALACAIGFHLSIGILMGLWGFALTMILCDVVLLPEQRLKQLAQSLIGPRSSPASSVSAVASPHADL